MLLTELFEMTQRTGLPAPDYDFSNLQKLAWNFLGKMQHGYDVVDYEYSGNIMYGVRVDGVITSVTVTHIKMIPGVGKVLETILSRTDEKYKGSLLSIKLKYFLTHHLGLSILLSDIHSIATEQLLKKIDNYFETKLINVKTGEVVEWTYDKYLRLSSSVVSTTWQVLLIGTTNPFNESVIGALPGQDPLRHQWTYYEFFEDCKN